MNILYERGNYPLYFEVGLGSAFGMIGHNFTIYDPSQTAVFDAFDAVLPDMYIGPVANQRRAVSKCIAESGAKFYAVEAIPVGADVINFKAGDVDDRLKSEVVYIGGHSEILEEYIQIASHFQFKIFRNPADGDLSWGTKNDLGFVDIKMAADIYASSQCSLAFDDMSKFYQILLSGGFPLANRSIVSRIPYAFGFDSPESMRAEITEIVRTNSSNRMKIVKKEMMEYVMRNNTYFHRIFDLFNNIKRPREATRTLEFYYANFPIR